MLDREEARAGPGRGVDLRVDVLDVVSDGLRRDHEPARDLLVRVAVREQPEHVDLPRREAGRPTTAARDAMAGRSQHRLDRVGVQPSGSDLRPQLGRGRVRRQRRPVRTRLAHRLIRVGCTEDPPSGRDRRAGEPGRVAGAVEPLAQLHDDLSQRRERFRLPQHALGQVRVQPHPLPLARSERPGLVPDRVRDAEPSEAVDEPGAPQRRSMLQQSVLGRGPRRELGDGLRVAEHERGLEVDEGGDRLERPVDLLAREDDLERRLGLDHGVPRRRRLEPREQPVGVVQHDLAEGWIELAGPAACGRARAPRRRRRPDTATSRNSASCAMRAAIGIASPCTPRGHPLPFQISYEPSRASTTVSGRSSCSASARAMAACWEIMPSTSRRPEMTNSSPIRKRCRGGFPAPMRRIAEAAERTLVMSWSYLRRLERDVVAEPLRLLVGVGVAADAEEQRGVVDGRARVFVQPRPLGEAQRDQALAEHVLHRLPEAEVDAERESADDLGEPDGRASARGRHGAGRRPEQARRMRSDDAVVELGVGRLLEDRAPVAVEVGVEAAQLPAKAEHVGARRRVRREHLVVVDLLRPESEAPDDRVAPVVLAQPRRDDRRAASPRGRSSVPRVS